MSLRSTVAIEAKKLRPFRPSLVKKIPSSPGALFPICGGDLSLKGFFKGPEAFSKEGEVSQNFIFIGVFTKVYSFGAVYYRLLWHLTSSTGGMYGPFI